MKVQGYLILEPGADRPYFAHNPPSEYQRKPGAKVYDFVLDIPDFCEIDGRITATASLIPEQGT
jgi:hypothetical protein